MKPKCKWTRYGNDVNWSTHCGHTYFPYINSDNQPKIIDDICPYCNRKIEYNDEGGDEDYD